MTRPEHWPAVSEPPPKRRMRNFLLDPRFQLKYVSMVVGVTVAVAAVLGYFAYDYSRGQTELMTMMRMESQGEELDEETMSYLESQARAEDRRVLIFIAAGILILAVALGLTGIIVTHRVVGPAYKLKKLLTHVRQGHLNVDSRLRKHDELKDVFIAFEKMVGTLREAQQIEISQLEAALQRARDAGVPEESMREIYEVRDRMRSTLQ